MKAGPAAGNDDAPEAFRNSRRSDASMPPQPGGADQLQQAQLRGRRRRSCASVPGVAVRDRRLSGALQAKRLIWPGSRRGLSPRTTCVGPFRGCTNRNPVHRPRFRFRIR